MPRQYNSRVQVTCAQCGKVEMRAPSMVSPERNFCSRACYFASNRAVQRVERVMRACTNCGASFPLLPSEIHDDENQFCSKACYHQWARGENHGRYKEVHADRVDARGYIHQYAPDHPRASGAGFVRQHILVAEQMIGGPLPAGTVIHHISGVKADNRPENLQIMTPSEHARMHELGRGPVYSSEQLVEVLRELARREGGVPAGTALKSYPDLPSFHVFWKRFGSWGDALAAAGLPPERKQTRRRANPQLTLGGAQNSQGQAKSLR